MPPRSASSLCRCITALRGADRAPGAARSVDGRRLKGAGGCAPRALALAVFAAFYGAFGAFRLGVWIDLLLLAGAVALVALALRKLSKRVGSVRGESALIG